MKSKLFILISFCTLLMACSNPKLASKLEKNNTVKDVLKQQIDLKTNDEIKESDSILNYDWSADEPSKEDVSAPLNEEDNSGLNSKNDLTKLNSELVYASIYSLMMDPEDYVGQEFKMRGKYYASFYEPNNKYYHYIIIEDALACCAQGIEFIWEDGTHKYPDEYPANEAIIEIQGTFETYKEAGDDRTYSRINNASMIVIN